MTDYQLLRLWDRLKDLTVSEHPCTGMSRTYKPCADYFDADFIDAAAVAILREEMGKEPKCGSEHIETICMDCPFDYAACFTDDPSKAAKPIEWSKFITTAEQVAQPWATIVIDT